MIDMHAKKISFKNPILKNFSQKSAMLRKIRNTAGKKILLNRLNSIPESKSSFRQSLKSRPKIVL